MDLHNAFDTNLLADRLTPRINLGTSFYFLVYGKEYILPQNIYLLALYLSQVAHKISSDFLQTEIDSLSKLEEERNTSKEKFHVHQQRIMRWFYKHATSDKQFQVSDLVLKWDKASEARGKYSKFQKIWLGPE